jgi:hypothetical protein
VMFCCCRKTKVYQQQHACAARLGSLVITNYPETSGSQLCMFTGHRQHMFYELWLSAGATLVRQIAQVAHMTT